MRTSVWVFLGLVFAASLGRNAPAFSAEPEIIGTGLGAALGGVVGSQFGHNHDQIISTGVGIAVGGLIGNAVGRGIEQEASPRAYYPDGNYYGATGDQASIPYYSYTPNYVAPPAPPPTYVDQNEDTYCRQYSQEIHIDGEAQESYGVACLQPDGTWRVVQ